MYFVPNSTRIFKIIYLVSLGLVFLIQIPLNIKRLHDSNKSGYLYLIQYLSIVLNSIGSMYEPKLIIYEIPFQFYLFKILSFICSLYMLILILKAGTKGKNRYGSVKNTNIKKIGIITWSICISVTLAFAFFRFFI